MSISGHIIPVGEARILLYEVCETVEELFGRLSLLNLAEYSALKSEKRRLEYLGLRIALKELLAEDKIVLYDASGKPFLEDNSYHISFSHSGNWIAVMTHPDRAVGVDVEIPTDKVSTLYTRFLNETEQKEISGSRNQLLIAWSAKEALYKIIGKEAVDFANQLHIFPFRLENEGTFVAEHIPSKQKYQLHYIQNEAYTLVYCIG